MAYIAQGPLTNGASFLRTFRSGNARPADEKYIGLKETGGGGGGGSIPTEGIIWWPKK